MSFEDAINGSVNPNDVVDSLLRQVQPSAVSPVGGVNPNTVVDRLTRKVMGARRERIADPAESAPAPAAAPDADAPDFSDKGVPADKLPDFSSFGVPVEAAPVAPATPPVAPTAAPAKPGFASTVGTTAIEGGKGFVEGVKNMPATSLKSLAAVAHEPVLKPEQRGMLDELEAVAADPAAPIAKRSALMAKALKTLPRMLQRDYNMAVQNISRGGNAAEHMAKLRKSFDDFDAQAAKGPTGRESWKAAEKIEELGKETLAPAPGFEGSWTRDIGSGFGSLLTGMTLSLLPGGQPLAMSVFVTGGQGEAADRAAKAGASPEKIKEAAYWGSAAGATDIVDSLLPTLGSPGKVAGFISRVGAGAIKSAMWEGGQEGVQELIQNAIERGLYNPNKDITDNVPRSMLIGAIVGSVPGAIVGAVEKPPQQQPTAGQPGAAPAAGAPGATPPPGGAGPSGTSSPKNIAEFVRQADATNPNPQPSRGEHQEIDDFIAGKDGAGTDSTAAAPAPEAQAAPSYEASEEYAVLRAAGWMKSAVEGMSEPERKQAYQEAIDEGIDVAAAVKKFKPADATRAAPIVAETAEDVIKASQKVLPSPSAAQAQAENYQHAHVDLPTLSLTGKSNVSLETPAGGERKGTGADGKPWVAKMPDGVAYGRIKGTKGADQQPLDIFIGPNPKSPMVVVIDQVDPKTGKFDEHKIMSGFASPMDALQAYTASYSDGQGGARIGGTTVMNPSTFAGWIKSGKTQRRLSKVAKSDTAAPAAAQDDSMYERAKALVIADKKASTSYVQRKLQLGYKHASEIMDRLEKEGVVSAADHRGARTVNAVAAPSSTHSEDGAAGAVDPVAQTGANSLPVPESTTAEAVERSAPEEKNTVSESEQATESSQHIEAVEDAIMATGENPDDVQQSDIARAAEIVAETGATPADAFQQAVVENAIEQGLLTEQEAESVYGESIQGLQADEPATRSGEQDRGTEAGQVAGEAGVVQGSSEDGEADQSDTSEGDVADTERDTSDQADESAEDGDEGSGDADDAGDVAGKPVIGTGTILRTKSGRETSPAPKIDATTDRKAKASLQRMNAWLLTEARKEAEGNDWQTTLLEGIDIKNLSKADQDTINDVLFGDPDGAKASNVINPDTLAEDDDAKRERLAKEREDAIDPIWRKLIDAAGGTNNRFLMKQNNGLIRNPDEKSASRLMQFPIEYSNEDGEGPKLLVKTAVQLDAPFTKKMEEASGLKAEVKKPGHGDYSLYHHAVDLATDEGWQELAKTADLIGTENLFAGVKVGLHHNNITPENVRKLMAELDEEPLPRAEVLEGIKSGHISDTSQGKATAYDLSGAHQLRMWVWVTLREEGFVKKKGGFLNPTQKLIDYLDGTLEIDPNDAPPTGDIKKPGRKKKGGEDTKGDPAKPTATEPVTEPVVDEEKPDRIQDAGEKIGGARKDTWIGAGLDEGDTTDMTGAERDRHIIKNNIWAKPDYVQAVDLGVERKAAALIKRIYDRIAAKPNGSYFEDIAAAQKAYIKALKLARGTLSDAKTVDDVKKASRKISGDLDYKEIHAVQQKGSRKSPFYVSYEDERAAERAVEQGFPVIEAWQRFFYIHERSVYDQATRKWTDDKEYSVYRKTGGVGVVFKTKEEAEAGAKAAYEKLSADQKSNEQEPKRPHLDNIDRSGPDYRGGKDVGSEDFIKDFGFKGVEFGNWVAGDERQKVVNLAYDALNDLARILNLPAKAMSLDGTLSVAFGARGKGGRAAAHYEADRTVINMTKLSGAGSLAHEWAHALDHYLGEMDGGNYGGAPRWMSRYRTAPNNTTYLGYSKDYNSGLLKLSKKLREASNRLMQRLFFVEESDETFETRIKESLERYEGAGGWKRELDRAVEALRAAKDPGARRSAQARIKKAESQIEIWGRGRQNIVRQQEGGKRLWVPTPFFKEAQKLSGKTGDYWKRPLEMFARSFETYVFDKIAAEGNSSQYLVQGVEETRFGSGFRGNPYPSNEDRVAINALYDRFVRALTTAPGKLGEGTKVVGAEGDPEPVAERVRVPKPQPQAPIADEAKAVEDSADEATNKDLSDAFAQHFRDGKGFEGIIQARKFAKEAGHDIDNKVVEEAIEFGVVKAAREIVAASTNPDETFKALVDLYKRQPKLGTRTSTSVRDQAYSTPMPLAYVASRLAGISRDTLVFEPTAGNGALLIEADPKNSRVNEINPTRAANLESMGFSPSQVDATDRGLATGIINVDTGVDVVIANPPFGVVRDDKGESTEYLLREIAGGFRTTEIDQAIVFRSLEAMHGKGGKAVLIVGGLNKLLTSREARSDAYNGKSKRTFYYNLYNNYNVTDHFTVAGELYERQGAGWPVDVIVIEGRGKSQRRLPAADVPRIYNSWDELGGLIDGVRTETGTGGFAVRPDDGVADPALEGRAGAVDVGDRGDLGAGRDVGQPEAIEPESVERGPVQRPGDEFAPERGGEAEVQAGDDRGAAGTGDAADAEQSPSGLTDDFDSAFDDALDASYGKKPLLQRARERGAQAFREGISAASASDPGFTKILTEANAAKQVLPVLKAWSDGWMEENLAAPVDGIEPTPSMVRREKATKVAKDAVTAAVDSADAAFSGLYQLFGGDKASSGFTFDEDTYKKAKPLFEQAASKFAEFKGNTAELLRRMVAHMRDTLKWPREIMERMRPYLRRFMEESAAAPAAETVVEKTEATQQKAAHKRATETAGQVTYTPKSKAPDLDTLVPVNMRRSIEDSLAALEDRVGPIDQFVADELGYTEPKLYEYLGAEQIDALGLAIDNIKRGKGFIIGDQTGIGKGRVNAAIIRWAMKNDRVPVFVTQMPILYKDIYRDLMDINATDGITNKPLRILATNAALKMSLDDVGKASLTTREAKVHNATLGEFSDEEKLRQRFDVVFTNYSQMQTLKGEDTARRQFLQAIAPNSVLIFDESHNAGGQKETRKATDTAPGRASFARDIIQKANGVFYSSATYAKRPDVMDLYAATDMAMAVEDISSLGEAISSGGVPMQQAVASMLAESGQYIRRERSFDGIRYDTELVNVDRETYNDITYALAAIQDFSASLKDSIEQFIANLKEEGEAMTVDGSTGEAGVISTNFTSIMHNIINQMLLAMKVEPGAKLAIEAIQRGEKPVLTVSNTMESFLTDYADTVGIKSGDVMTASFNDVLKKYLDRTRTVIIKPPNAKKGESRRHYLTDGELDANARAMYQAASNMIDGLELSNMPISPIDHLKVRLAKEGYRVGEITGRGSIIDYTDPSKPILRPRPSRETSIQGKNETISAFNDGKVDAIVLNQSGSTGLSLHSHPKFKDTKQRHMMIVQAEGNIDTHMQILGRVNRTGQSNLPRYTQVGASIPAEVRPMAVLAKKMASLNANTTASRTSAVTAKDVVDFINDYGDEVAAAFISDHLELNQRLGNPVKISESGKVDRPDAMRKLTGRIMLRPVEEQEQIINTLIEEYEGLLAQIEASGENALEARTLDLKAKIIETSEVQGRKNDSGSPFAAPVFVHKVSVARLGKPYTPQQIMKMVYDYLGAKIPTQEEFDERPSLAAKLLEEVNDTHPHTSFEASKLARNEALDRGQTPVAAFDDFMRDILLATDDVAVQEKRQTVLRENRSRWMTLNENLSVGRRIVLKTVNGNLTGIVLKVEQKGEPKNPLALGSWRVTFALADAHRQITLPFSRLFENEKADPDSFSAIEYMPMTHWYESYKDTLGRYEALQSGAREERFIASGNILAAYDWLGMKGSIINYTDHKGRVQQGVLTAKDFDLTKHAVNKGRLVNDPAEVKEWLEKNLGATIYSKDGNVSIGMFYQDYAIQLHKSKRRGGIYFLDKTLTDITGDFYSRGDKMTVHVRGDTIPQAVKRMMELGAQFTIPTGAPKPTKAEEEVDETPTDDGAAPMASMAERQTVGNEVLTPEAQESEAKLVAVIEQAVRHFVGNNVSLEFHQGLIPLPSDHDGGWGDDIASKAGQSAVGLYFPSHHFIRLAILSADTKERTGRMAQTAAHESYHAIEGQLLTDQERALMDKETPRLREYISDYMDKTFGPGSAENVSDEEVRAIAFQRYFHWRINGGERGTGIHIGVRQFFERLIRALRSALNAINGLGFKTYEDIFNSAYRGEFAQRESADPDIDGAPQAAMHPRRPIPPLTNETINQQLENRNLTRLARVSRALKFGRINTTEIRTQLQDKFIRVRNAQEAVDPNTPVGMNAYLQESLYYGRTGNRLEQLERNRIEPMIADMKARNITLEEIDEFLYARHAQERNAEIDAINPALGGAGSGMTDQDAQDIIDRVMNGPQRNDYLAVERRVRQIIDETRQTLLSYGLISQDQADEWENKYSNYVPLRGFAEAMEDEQHFRQQTGYNIRGGEARQAFGRRSEADSPLSYVLMQAETAIVRGEKNRVGNSFLRFIEANPDPTRWTVDIPERRPIIDPNTGLVTYIADISWVNDPNVFATKIGGEIHRITLHGNDGINLARALKSMGSSNMHSVIRFVSMLTRIMARLSTQWNPEFMIPNFARDAGEAFINLQAQQQRGFVKSFSKHLMPAMFGAMRAVASPNATSTNRYVNAFHEFDKAGGRIRFFGLDDVDDVRNNVQSMLRRLEGGVYNSARNAADAAAEAVDTLNTGIENATRLAAYMAARDVGMSIPQAASLARELTVNFNRKGELGSIISGLYMFANAGLQGMTRMMTALQNKNVRRAVWALAASGVLAALYNMGAGGDDDDGTPYYLKIRPWDRDKNLIVMWPKGWGHDGQYVKVPLPYGYAMFHVLGARIASMFYGEKPSKAGGAILSSVVDAFDPVGHDQNIVAAGAPTILRPGIHIAMNQNWTGAPLYPNAPNNRNTPDSQRYFSTASGFSKEFAEQLNKLTGGSAYKPGWIDWHPGSIDHTLQAMTGGLGRFVKGTIESGYGALTGDFDPEKAPIARRFIGSVDDQSRAAAYREMAEPERKRAAAVKAAQKDRNAGINVGESDRFIDENAGQGKSQIFARADRQIKRLRDEAKKLEGDRNISDQARKEQIEAIRARIREVQSEARREAKDLK